MRRIVILILILLILPFAAQGLVIRSGDMVVVSEPVDDDLFCTGGQVTVEAPVNSLIATAGTVTVNGAVRGDILAAGGTVVVNGPVGGKVVAAGGTVDIRGTVGSNVVLAGGSVTLGPNAVVGKDALIAGGTVHHAGTVMGNLTVRGEQFTNTGTAGRVEYEPQRSLDFAPLFAVLTFLVTIGWFLLGLMLVLVMPHRFTLLADETRSSTLLKTVLGFGTLVLGSIAVIFLLITLVGIPFALLGGALLLLLSLLSGVVVAYGLGRWIFSHMERTARPWVQYFLGFIVLAILFWIPILNLLVALLTVSLGSGTILSHLRNHWALITGSP
jgi:hypothetical protein